MTEDDRRSPPDSADFDPVVIARRLAREARAGALSTLDGGDGRPFGSLTAISGALDGAPILLLSRLARHTRNLDRDPRASLLIAEPTGRDPQTAARITLLGRIVPVDDDAPARRRHLARHPDAALWAGFADFRFHRLVVEEVHVVAGFGRAARLRGAAMLLDPATVAGFAAHEQACLAAAGRDRGRLARIAARLGADGRPITVVDVDPEGLDLAIEDDDRPRIHRMVSPRPIDAAPAIDRLLDDWAGPPIARDFD
jgi:putative heme iron utilization protein